MASPMEGTASSSEGTGDLSSPVTVYERKPEGDVVCIKVKAIIMPQGPPLKLLLLGKTGKGKSSTGNTILSESTEGFSMERFTESNSATTSETKDATECSNTVRGREITVMDTPGTCDTKLTHRGVIGRIADAVAKNPDGYNAFVIVMRCGDKFTKEERLSMELLELLFGENIYDYTVFVFTDGRSFFRNQEKRHRKGEKKVEFEDHILKDKESKEIDAVGPYVKRSGGGAVLFENLEENYAKRWENTNELIQRVDKIQEAALRGNIKPMYDNHMFKEARKKRLEMGKTFPVERLTDHLTDYAEWFLEVHYKNFMERLKKIASKQIMRLS